jgi:hypothetical protein
MSIEMVQPTLHGLLQLAQQLPDEEREVYEALTGEKFDPERYAAQTFLAPGIHHMGLRYGAEPVFAGGFLPNGEGVYRTWFCAPEWAWKAHGNQITLICDGFIRGMLAAKLAQRVETVTLASHTRARQWYEKLGLKYESTLHGPNSGSTDAVVYVAESG